MADRIDQSGVYRGKITEMAVNVSSGGYPQVIVRISADEKYIDSPADMEYFGIEEPSWVDWSDNNEDALGYLILFMAKVLEGERPTEDNASFHYKNLMEAVGWEGTSFDSLNDDSLIGTPVQFHMAEDTYNGQTRLQLKRVKAFDASPNSELRKLDDDTLSALNQALRGSFGRKKAKPAAAPAKGKVKAAKPKPKPKPKAEEPEDDQEEQEEQEEASKPKPKPKAKPKSSPPPVEEDEDEDEGCYEDDDVEADVKAVEEASDFPAEVSKLDAWNAIQELKGDNDDTTIEKAFIDACHQICDGRQEKDFTKKDWAAVRDIVIEELSLTG